MFVCGFFSRVVVRYRTQYNYALSLEKSILKKKDANFNKIYYTSTFI